MRSVARTYAGARGAAGPLVFVEGARGALLGETVAIEVPGQPGRRLSGSRRGPNYARGGREGVGPDRGGDV